MMQLVEHCSCGASLDITHAWAPSVAVIAAAWRADHQHTDPAPITDPGQLDAIRDGVRPAAMARPMAVG
jgi:hypothetical protein